MTPKPINCHPSTLAWAQLKLRLAFYRLGVQIARNVTLGDFLVMLLAAYAIAGALIWSGLVDG